MATTPVAPGRLDAGSEIKVPDGSGGEKVVKISGRYEVYTLEDASIVAGIESGQIIRDENVVVKVGDDYCVYTQLLATDLDTMKLLCGGPVELVLDDNNLPKKGEPSVASKFNYGNDLDAKRSVRQAHEKKAAGPEKDITKAIKALMAVGYSEDDATALARAKQEAAPAA